MPEFMKYKTKEAKAAYVRKMKKDEKRKTATKKKGMGYAYGKDSKKMSHGKDYKNHSY